MDPQLHSINKVTVQTAAFFRRSGSEEDEDGEIGRNGDGSNARGTVHNDYFENEMTIDGDYVSSMGL